MTRTCCAAILQAVDRCERPARNVFMRAVGHESAMRSLRRGLDVRVSTVEALCRELGLEFYVGPWRHRGACGPHGFEDSVHSPDNSRVGGIELGSDRYLAELVARLADHCEAVGPDECRRPTGAIAGLLDVVGATSGRRAFALAAADRS